MAGGDDIEHDFMHACVEEAAKCHSEDGRISPSVGALVAIGGVELARAHRGEFAPGEHAEFTLLERKLKDRDLSGATLYTTLEPCTRRNSPKVPCADRIAERRITRVAIGTMDPNPDISGKGVLRLRDADIEVALFPGELMSRIENLNDEFSREHRITPFTLESAVDLLSTRTLDAWYIAVNRIYGERNSHRPLSFVLAHLVEVVGGLSCLASEKTKPSVEPATYVQKAIAWWLALCGQAGVRSAEDVIFRKFPGACPYCEQRPHSEDHCRQRKAAGDGPDWASLKRIAAEGSQPTTPGEWVRMFRSIYPVSQNESYGHTFARLSEELGELSEAVRLFESEPNYFLSEAADVFAWLCRVENIRETKAGTHPDNVGFVLDQGLARSYPDFCLDCETRPCRCPAVLKRTIGRIAKEMPAEMTASSFMASDERRALFRT